MERLWRSGPATVAEVREALGASGYALAYTTILTILARLYEKGFVGRTKEGRHFRYSASFDEAELVAEAGRRELRRLIERHGAASVAAFACDLAGADSELVAGLRELAARDRHPEQ